MEKYFQIGEISHLYNIGVDSLRYYEELGLINPERSEAGYRLYGVNDIWRLNVIRELRDIGFGMDRIKEYLDNHNVETTVALLQEEKKAIIELEKKLKKMKANIKMRTENLALAGEMPVGIITEKEYPLRPCFSIAESYAEEEEMDILIKRLLNIDKKHFYIIGNNQIGTVISRENLEKNGRLKNKSVFIIDENGTEKLASGKYISICYKGKYSQSVQCGEKLINYAKENNLTLVGDFYEILWIDNHTSSNTDEYLTELQILVK